MQGKRVLDYHVRYANDKQWGHSAFNNQDDANRYARRIQRLGYRVQLYRYMNDLPVELEIESEVTQWVL